MGYMTPLIIALFLIPMAIFMFIFAAMSGPKSAPVTSTGDHLVLEELVGEQTPVAFRHTFSESASAEPYVRELTSQSKTNTPQDPRWRM